MEATQNLTDALEKYNNILFAGGPTGSRRSAPSEHSLGNFRLLPDMRIRFVLPVFLLWVLFACNPSAASDLALVHAKIYPSPTEPAIEDGTILVHDGRMTGFGPGATTRPRRFARAVTVIDCKGLVVTGGFWNKLCVGEAMLCAIAGQR